MRASWLSRPEVAALLNSTCVNLNVDKNDVDDLEGTAWLIDPGTPTTFYLLSPDGKLLDKVETFGEDLPGRIRALARSFGVKADPESPRPITSRPLPPARNGALALEVTARWLPSVSADEYPSTAWRVPSAPGVLTEGLIIMRQAVPTLEWVVLDEPQWRTLLPPAGASVGDAWTVDLAAAVELLWRLRPPTHYSALLREDVEHATLTARLEAAHRVRLEGSLSALDPWFPDATQQGPEQQVPHRAEADVVGYVALAGGRIESLELTTVGGRLTGPDGSLLPYGAVVRSAAPWPASGP